MPATKTKYFGEIDYEAGTEIEFPRGLPGFEDRRRFVMIRHADSDPLLYLQSLDDLELCFLTMPVLAVDGSYRLQLSREDLELIRFARQPNIGDDVLCVAVLSLRESGPTANLLAPVVVNLRNRLAVQAVAVDTSYPHQLALLEAEAGVCS